MYNDYNGRDNVINGLLIDNLEVECKQNIKGLNKKYILIQTMLIILITKLLLWQK
jgi:hypothetical protein